MGMYDTDGVGHSDYDNDPAYLVRLDEERELLDYVAEFGMPVLEVGSMPGMDVLGMYDDFELDVLFEERNPEHWAVPTFWIL